MVDTAVRPRPEFSTFLFSDQNAGGDGLSFYNFKKMIRSQKVALLQQKRSVAKVPGCKLEPAMQEYKKVLQQDEVAAGSRVSDAETQTAQLEIKKEHNRPENNKDSTPVVLHPQQTSLTARLNTDRPTFTSRVKSATFHTNIEKPLHQHKESIMQRPKTAGDVQYYDQLWKPSTQDCRIDDIEDNKTPQQQQQMKDEYVNKASKELDINTLIKSYTWTTSTKRAYNEVGWENKIPSVALSTAPSVNLRNSPPDPVSLRFVNKRNDLYPQQWQCLGTAWDMVQSRLTSVYKRPNDKNTFCSPFKHNRQIPGYQGCTPGENVSDFTEGKFEPYNSIYSHQPRPTKISRRPNIPGYTGCTMWSNDRPAHANVGYPKRTTQTRSYGMYPVDENVSPFIRTSVLSKMVSLNSPYNPFNKIEPVQ